MSDSIHLVLRGRGEPNSGFSVFKVLYTLPEKVQVPQKQKLFRPHLVILTDSDILCWVAWNSAFASAKGLNCSHSVLRNPGGRRKQKHRVAGAVLLFDSLFNILQLLERRFAQPSALRHNVRLDRSAELGWVLQISSSPRLPPASPGSPLLPDTHLVAGWAS